MSDKMAFVICIAGIILGTMGATVCFIAGWLLSERRDKGDGRNNAQIHTE